MLKWLKKKRRRHSQGFSMLEVLVAILTITTFLAGTLQLIAIDALYKVKAEREAQANFWMQEDLEQIKSESAAISNACGSGSYTGDSNYTYTITSRNNYSRTDYDGSDFGSAIALSDEIAKLDSNSSLPGAVNRKLIGKTYDLKRTYSTTDGSPHTLGITYEVTLADGEQANDYQNQERTIATRYAEVIPDASFNCNP